MSNHVQSEAPTTDDNGLNTRVECLSRKTLEIEKQWRKAETIQDEELDELKRSSSCQSIETQIIAVLCELPFGLGPSKRSPIINQMSLSFLFR